MGRLRWYCSVLIVALGILVPFVFFSSSYSARTDLNLGERVFLALKSPVDYSALTLKNSVKNLWNSYINLVDTKSEIDRLKDLNSELTVQMQVLKELESENARLRDMLNFVNHVGLKFISGEVRAADPTFLYRSVRINRGQNDGVLQGMAVVSAEGAVGVVMRTGTRYSDVLLINDPNSDLDVVVVRNRRRGVVEGTVSGLLRFKFFDKGTKIQVGDEIITSGLTGSFPPGVPVGRVVKVTTDDKLSSEIVEVESAVNMLHLSEALILLQSGREIETIRRIGGDDWMRQIMESVSTRGGGS